MDLVCSVYSTCLCRVHNIFIQSENLREVIREELPQLGRGMLGELCMLVHTLAGGWMRFSQQFIGPCHTPCSLAKLSLDRALIF